MAWSFVYMSMKKKGNAYTGAFLSATPAASKDDYTPIHSSNNFMLAMELGASNVEKLLTFYDEAVMTPGLKGSPRFWLDLRSLPSDVKTELKTRSDRCEGRDNEVDEQTNVLVVDNDEALQMMVFDRYANNDLISVQSAWQMIKDL